MILIGVVKIWIIGVINKYMKRRCVVGINYFYTSIQNENSQFCFGKKMGIHNCIVFLDCSYKVSVYTHIFTFF